ncbi:hypothetical protein, partial [Bacteroides nordii]|uniref:hypothetical protein n=1 Tax=Bacteroides nordii TaxID=291645 RepID=UPI0021E67D7C
LYTYFIKKQEEREENKKKNKGINIHKQGANIFPIKCIRKTSNKETTQRDFFIVNRFSPPRR